MMTGALLGGAPVARASRLQMIIMFLLSGSAALSALITTVGCIAVVCDPYGRVRGERIVDSGKGKGSKTGGEMSRRLSEMREKLRESVVWLVGRLRGERGQGRYELLG